MKYIESVFVLLASEPTEILFDESLLSAPVKLKSNENNPSVAVLACIWPTVELELYVKVTDCTNDESNCNVKNSLPTNLISGGLQSNIGE